MSRLFIALLIPLVLANQGLGCLHAHGGTIGVHGHAARPHIHWADASEVHDDAHGDGHDHPHPSAATSNDEPAQSSGLSLTTPSSHDDAIVLVSARDAVQTDRLSGLNWSQQQISILQPAAVMGGAQGVSGSLTGAAWRMVVRPPKVPIFLRDVRILC